ncbi:MAG: putative Ig domain-containing protein, partial [Verrucomicrobiota bacterium]
VTVVAVDNGVPSMRTTNEFTVAVLEANSPPVASVLPLQTAIESKLVQVQLAGTDPDVPANKLSFSLLEGPPTATVDPVTGIFEWVPGETDAPATNTYKFVVTDDGVPPLSGTNEFTVVILETNSAPVFEAMEMQTVIEGETLSVPVKVIDPDMPANLLIHLLASGPTGSKIDARTGVFTWKPGEADGPGTHKVTVVAVDNGVPSMRATNEFTVAVLETNSPPVALAVAEQTIAEGQTLRVTLRATDSDLPVNELSFALIDPLPEAEVDPKSGMFTWTPAEAHGPGLHQFTFVVTDNGEPAMSATNQFSVNVLETNDQPAFEPTPQQTVIEGETLTVSVAASDSDLPANVLAYSLALAPPGAAIDARNGLFTWTPTETDGPSTKQVRVIVVDNGQPSLKATNEFSIQVLETNLPPVLLPIAEQTIIEGQPFRLQMMASDADRPANKLTFLLQTAPPAAALDPNSGLLTWNPTETDGPGSNQFIVIVNDNGDPSLSATNEFMVIVLETNSPPVLESVSPQAVLAGEELVVELKGSDPDVPLQQIRFALEPDAAEGATLDAVTGQFRWTPPITHPTANREFVVRLTDDGVPPMSVTTRLQVAVTGRAVRIVDLAFRGLDSITFSWPVEAGKTYRVESNDTLDPSQWKEAAGQTTIAGGMASFVETLGATTYRFYRVVTLTP